MKKRTVTLFTALALTLGIASGAYAASNNQTISAMLNKDIKIMYNGQVQNFTDAKGAPVYPIAYNGTTYLPVSAVSKMLNVPINWDGTTNTIMMGATTVQPTNLVSRKHTGGTEYSYIINDLSVLSFDGSDAKHQFKNGVTWHQWNATMSYNESRVMYFDTTGFETVSFTVASDVKAMVKIVDQDGNNITSFENNEGQVQEKTITLNGATKIGFASDYYSEGLGVSGKRSGYVHFYDPILK